MAKKMLIDASHEEEIRLSVVAGNKLEEFDFETSSKQQIKGNVYLAIVTRVEPSLQAAFVEYGGNRQGFLPFSEIHPDYYQIPIEDRQLEEQTIDYDGEDDIVPNENGDTESEVESLGDDSEEVAVQSRKSRPRLKRHYKIQEVIKNRQVVLVQVVKEERGNKGAAMTTYLSLAGRYCVLMPNSSRGGGVSRKIISGQDRKRLKEILKELSEGKSGGVIVRTAGAGRTKVDIKRDYKYIYGLWDKIRVKTLKSIAPKVIYEEAGLINRAIRDMYDNTIDEIIIAGDKGYKMAKDYMKELTPSHAKKVQKYKGEGGIPLFQRYQVESQISHIYDSQVYLPSGGSIVLHQTEALVAIDVNSGRSIGERNVGAMAVKTNLEAAEEVARQLRLRDMAGLIVIDFIDMDDRKSNVLVERRLKESLNIDRARIQVGRISQFGLLEMSRQRLRPSLIDASSSSCPSCGGSGMIPNLEISAMATLRSIEEEVFRKRSVSIRVIVPTNVGFYLLNNKRRNLSELEQNFGIQIVLQVSDAFVAPKYEMIRIDAEGTEVVVGAASENSKGGRGKPRKKSVGTDRNNNKNRRSAKNTAKNVSQDAQQIKNDSLETQDTDTHDKINDTVKDTAKGKAKIRGFRGNHHKNKAGDTQVPPENQVQTDTVSEQTSEHTKDNPSDNTPPKKTFRRRLYRKNVRYKNAQNTGEHATNVSPENRANDVQKTDVSPVHTESVVRSNADDNKTVPTDDMSKPVSKKARAKKASAKKSSAKKSTAKKTMTKKATVKKSTAKKSTAKKTTAKKATAKKSSAKKSTVKKSTTKKSTTKKSTAKKATAKKTGVKKATPKQTPSKHNTLLQNTSSSPSTDVKTTSVSERKGWWS